MTDDASRSRKSIYLVVASTLFAAVAQVFYKYGAANPLPALEPAHIESWFAIALALVRNLPLFAGYFLSGITALLLTLALRDGELSVLYPIISMSYMWVSLLSVYFFHEHMNLWKVAGIALVIGGVALIGKASEWDREQAARQAAQQPRAART